MDTLFTHLLVPLDFTAKNQIALDYARSLAQQNRAEVTLLHVIERIEYVEDKQLTEFYDKLNVLARANLANRSTPFVEANVPVATKVIFGNTAREIVSYAMDQQVDLIVLSSHKVDLDEAPKGWATLSYQVSILCQCPVMLVK